MSITSMGTNFTSLWYVFFYVSIECKWCIFYISDIVNKYLYLFSKISRQPRSNNNIAGAMQQIYSATP